MVGLVPLFDPPRHDTKETIQHCHTVSGRRSARLRQPAAQWDAGCGCSMKAFPA